MHLPQQYADAMVEHALEDDPNECCGILAGTQTQVLQHYRITNSEHSPYRYLMEPREVLEAMRDAERNGWEFIAFYHSHTHTEAYPSATDIRLAENWPDPYYILVSLADRANPVIRAFLIQDGRVTEEPVAIA